MFKAVALPRELWSMIYHYSEIDVLDSLSKINKLTYIELSSDKFWRTYIINNKIKLIDSTVNCLTAQEWINEINYVEYIKRCTDSIFNGQQDEDFLAGEIYFNQIRIPLYKVNFNNVDILKGTVMSSYLATYKKQNSKNIGELHIENDQWVYYSPKRDRIASQPVMRSTIQCILYQIYKNLIYD